MPKRAPLTLREKRERAKRVKATKAKLKAIGRHLKPAEVRAYLNRIDPPPGAGVRPEVTAEVPTFMEPCVLEHAPGCATKGNRPHTDECHKGAAGDIECHGEHECVCTCDYIVHECDCADLNPETTTDVTISDAPWWKCRRGHLYQAPEWSYQTRSALPPLEHKAECKAGLGSTYVCECPPDVTTQDTGPLCNECWEIPSVRAELARLAADHMGTKRQEPEAARAEWARKVLAPS